MIFNFLGKAYIFEDNCLFKISYKNQPGYELSGSPRRWRKEEKKEAERVKQTAKNLKKNKEEQGTLPKKLKQQNIKPLGRTVDEANAIADNVLKPKKGAKNKVQSKSPAQPAPDFNSPKKISPKKEVLQEKPLKSAPDTKKIFMSDIVDSESIATYDRPISRSMIDGIREHIEELGQPFVVPIYQDGDRYVAADHPAVQALVQAWKELESEGVVPDRMGVAIAPNASAAKRMSAFLSSN